MVIVHISDVQRRVIAPGRDETVDQLCKRFCAEYRLSPLQFEFYSLSTNERLPVSLMASEVKELRLCPKSITGTCNQGHLTPLPVVKATETSITAKVTPPRPAPRKSLTNLEKTVKRKAPMPPETIKTLSTIDLPSDDGDVYIPQPPIDPIPTADNVIQCSFTKSIESNTDRTYTQVFPESRHQEENITSSCEDSDVSEDDIHYSNSKDDLRICEEPMSVTCEGSPYNDQCIEEDAMNNNNIMIDTEGHCGDSENGGSSVDSSSEYVAVTKVKVADSECGICGDEEYGLCLNDSEGSSCGEVSQDRSNGEIGGDDCASDKEVSRMPEEYRMCHRREECVREVVCTVHDLGVCLHHLVDGGTSPGVCEPMTESPDRIFTDVSGTRMEESVTRPVVVTRTEESVTRLVVVTRMDEPVTRPVVVTRMEELAKEDSSAQCLTQEYRRPRAKSLFFTTR